MVQKKKDEKRGRGRPRQFDAGAVLSAATRVFQRKGYDAASLDDLATATGLTRPSLYGAFGNKEALYLAALQAVAQDMEKHLLRTIKEAPSLEEALRAFYSGAIARYTGCGADEGVGCLLMTTGIIRAPDTQAIREYVMIVLDGLDTRMSQLYDAHYPGPPEQKRQKVLLAVSTLQTLSIRARAGAREHALMDIMEDVLPGLI